MQADHGPDQDGKWLADMGPVGGPIMRAIWYAKRRLGRGAWVVDGAVALAKNHLT